MDRRRWSHHRRASGNYGQPVKPRAVLGETCPPAVMLLGLLLGCSPASADTLAARGVALASACAVCHGPTGRSRGAIPGLDRLSPESFRRAMHTFQTQEPRGVMHYIAKGLAAEDIEAVAAHFTATKQHQ